MPQQSGDVYDELIREFYGIDPVRRRVENVAVTRSGKVSHWTVERLRDSSDDRNRCRHRSGAPVWFGVFWQPRFALI